MKLEYCYLGMKVCDMEIEIVTFVVNGSVKLTIPPEGQQDKIHVRSRIVALCHIFDLKFNRIHLTQVVLKIWVVYGQNIMDVTVCEIERVTRGATVTGCAPVVSFCCKGLY